jgi:pyridinium-3,5-bisthiocarboxylic acid mononucleotide nickel chelatase
MISNHRELAVVEFEVDDQTPEDLSIALDRLRELPSVFDVLQMPAFGKKGRMLVHVRVLAQPSAIHDVIAACFRETSTIGLRHHLVSGAALQRQVREVETEPGTNVRVKVVERPDGGPSAKAEADDIARAGRGYAARVALRNLAERQARELVRDGDSE